MVEVKKFIRGINARRITIFMILIYIIFSFCRIYNDSDFEDVGDREAYQSYLIYLDGPLTQEKESYLNAENILISEAKSAISSSADNLFNNNLNPNEFEKIYKENEIV